MDDEPDDTLEDDEKDEQQEEEFDLPSGAMCEHHPDVPAIDVYGQEPLCEECCIHYIDGYRSDN